MKFGGKKINMESTSNISEDDDIKEESQPLLDNKSKLSGTLKGLLFTALHTIGVGASAAAVPLLERKIPDFELNAFRCGVSLIIMTFGLLFTKTVPKISKSSILGLVLFCVVTFIAPVVGYTAASMVPLSYFKSLMLSSNIIFGLILFPLCLKEKTEYKSVLFAALCVAGVICSIQPEFIFTWKQNLDLSQNVTGQGNSSTYDVTKPLPKYSHLTILGCVLSSVGGLLDVYQIITLKKNPYLGENLMKCLWWTLLFSELSSIILMGIFEQPVLPKTRKEVILIGVHSMTFSVIYFSLMSATKYISGNTFNIIYSSLVIIMLIPQYTLLKHILPGNDNWIEVAGSFLVFIGATAGSIWELVKPK